MNIDERLEALTQTVELLAAMQKDNEQKQDQRLEKLIAAIQRVNQRGTRLESLVTDIAEGTARLLQVAEAHEQRISRLEEQHS